MEKDAFLRSFVYGCAKAIAAYCFYLFVQLLVPFCAAHLSARILCALAGTKSACLLPFAAKACLSYLREGTLLTPLFCAAFALTLVWGFCAARGVRLGDALQLSHIGFWRAAAFFLSGMLLHAAVVHLIRVLPLPEALIAPYVRQTAILRSDRFPVRFLALVIAIPIWEECLFRGLIQTHLQRAMGTVAAAVIQCTVFALVHGTPLWCVYAFFCALVCTFVRQKSGSLYASIALHMGFNLLSVFA